MQTQNLKPFQNTGRILLVGDADTAFTDSGELETLDAERCSTMLDAVNIASQKKFDTICVIISGFGPQVRPALKTLRQVNPSAKIILLVQMYEEPFAIEFVNAFNNQTRYADDYVICPVSATRFFSDILNRDKTQVKIAGDQPASEMIEQLTKLATEDELTGLKNRRYAREFLRQIIERAKTENMRLTLLTFDIDDFKHYNDTYGHAAGDDILRQAAVLMRNCCRKHDVVARMGGDEFAVIFWDAPKESEPQDGRRLQAEHPHEIFFLADRFRNEMNTAHLSSLGPEGKGVLTISGGLAGFPRDGSTVTELFEQADKALLDAKRSGKNRIYLVGRPQ